MKILIIGSGGREHVLAWKLRQSPQVKEIYCAPGNGGISGMAECVDIQAQDLEGLARFARERKIDLTVVGPEAPLVSGIVDRFRSEDLRIFGPDKFSAQLEGSKIFAKEFMGRWRIPTADFRVFDDYDQARVYLQEADFPLVIKADGLASGKGVFICANVQEALEALDLIFRKKVFNKAGDKIVVEECLTGEEASILALSDGRDYVLLESAQDHKRIFDEDLGPNTGGMGAYSPAPVINESMLRKIEARIIAPAIHGMRQEGHAFKGVLYAGLMIANRSPYVLEFNVRFGDPEAQAVLPRLKSDLADILVASSCGGMNKINLKWDRRSCVCVVMSSGGYPGPYETGKEITGLETISDPDVTVFHAGTRKQGKKIFTSGGRVLGVTALGENIETAIAKAYSAVEHIGFDRCFFRRDIGAKAARKLSAARRN